MTKPKSRKLQARSGTTNEKNITPELINFNPREIRLLEANERLAREAKRAKDRNADVIAAIQQVARDAAAALVLAPVARPAPSKARGSAEKAIVVVSDLQLGKVTPTYSTEVCERRMELYARKVFEITGVQRKHHSVSEARVYLLGDIVEGELIFAHQPWQVDSSLLRQVMVDGPRIVGNFLRQLLGHFEKVHVCGVIGNHGRLGPYKSAYNPESNMDRMLYYFLKEIFQHEPRITWDIPFEKNERAWYTVDYPFGDDGVGYLLFHGDQIRGGFAGFPHYGLAKKVWGWRSIGGFPQFSYAIFGHWHTEHRQRINSVIAFGNGSTESTNTYAQEQLAAAGEPTQLLMFARPDRLTGEYWVNLS